MTTSLSAVARSARRAMRILLGVAAMVAATDVAQAQFISRAVGGISVDPSGVLNTAEQDATNQLREHWQNALADVPGDLNQPAELRKISLRRLAETVAECQRAGQPLPDEVLFLAGLQRVNYVFVYPEQGDIVLAGYGEGWTVDRRGNIVGVGTGRPVLQLDDLLVALRTVNQAARGGITCSIDPTPEGLKRLQNFFKSKPNMRNPSATLAAIEKQLGPQTITLTGVPPTSHAARVLVAADYRMKRLAMKLDPTPVAGMPSFLDMMKSSRTGSRSMTPRWWLSTNYDPLLTDEEGLAWQLRGPGVKAMTETDFVTRAGQVQHSGQSDPLAQEWADTLTEKYDELSLHDPVFGELRNIMDLAVVAALIAKEDLASRVGLQFGVLLDDVALPVTAYDAPEFVDSKASTVKKGRDWLISASGGVEISSWFVADKKERSSTLAPVRAAAVADRSTSWWWN